MLVLLYISLLVEQVAARRWRVVIRTLVVGLTHGLVALTVYLPGLSSSGVSVHADTVDNDGFMTLTLNGLAVSIAPLARGDLTGWWGRYAPMPYTYIAWFLPLLLLVRSEHVRRVASRSVAALVTLGAVWLLAVGPHSSDPCVSRSARCRGWPPSSSC